MNHKISSHRFYFILFSFLSLVLIVINSCKKQTYNSVDNIFNISASKEWWYGSFRKSTAYSQIDYSSIYAPSVLDVASAKKKYPSWKRAVEYISGELQIIEMPLVYNKRIVIFPGSSLLSTDDKKRIAESSLHRLLLIKKPNNTVSIRTITLIPSLYYARSKNFDISNNSLKEPDPNFSGWLVVRNWSEKVIGLWQIENGRRVRKYINKKIDPNQQSRNATVECFQEPYIEGVVGMCVGTTVTGDEPSGNEECNEWVITISIGSQLVCEPSNEESGDPLEDCFGMSDMECACAIAGLGCDNHWDEDYQAGPSNNDLLNEFDDSIIDSLNHECLKSILSSLKGLQGGKIAEIIYKLSGDIPSWDWKLKEGSTTIGRAETFDDAPNGAYTVFNYSSFQNSTDLAIARTMIHEAVHAFLLNYFNNDPASAQLDYPQLFEAYLISQDTALVQHELMGEKFVADIAAALKAYGVSKGYNFSDEVYRDIAWGGLYNETTGVSAFNKLLPFERERIRHRNSAEISGFQVDDQVPVGTKICN